MAFNLQKNDSTSIFVRYFLHIRSSVYGDNDDYHVPMVRIDRDSDCLARAMKRKSAEHEDDQY